ncbi:hypothetical protein [Bacteroides sp.]|uniref:hypothetical protein n=1 Tax=Bacteroides sp. TaxID=29523 RepID=UPI002607CF09|nr:hypothetical protein [Bacteroides sp.]MDD3039597.1 hypothetical protein [Bacteroides sp.]
MVYDKKTWVRDEIIFENDMNDLEDGVEAAHIAIDSHIASTTAHGSLGRILGALEIGIPNGLAGLNDSGALEIQTVDLPQLVAIGDDDFGASLRANSANGLELLSNAYYTDGIWRRYVNAYAALALVLNPIDESFKMLYAPAGSEDIESWSSLYAFSNSGNFTIAGELAAATVRTTSSIYSEDGLSAATIASRGSLSILTNSQLRIYGAGSYYVGLSAPAALAATYSLILPDADGEAGQALITDGAGNLDWGEAGGDGGVAIGNIDGGRADSVYSVESLTLSGGSASS